MGYGRFRHRVLTKSIDNIFLFYQFPCLKTRYNVYLLVAGRGQVLKPHPKFLTTIVSLTCATCQTPSAVDHMTQLTQYINPDFPLDTALEKSAVRVYDLAPVHISLFIHFLEYFTCFHCMII